MASAPSSAAPPLLNLIAAKLTAGTEEYRAMATLVTPSFAVTADHVIREDQSFLLHFDAWLGGPTVRASVVARDSVVDFAVLRLEFPFDLPPLALLVDDIPPPGIKWECLYINPSAPESTHVSGQMGVKIANIDGHKHLTLIPNNPPSFDETKGMSGAPVLVSRLLVGIVARTNPEGDEWYAIPTAEMLKSEAWKVITDETQTVSGEERSSSGDTEQPEQSDELDAAALFRRLSPSSMTALRHADGIRRALGQDKIHMEHFIAGLFQKRSGPTRKALSEAGIDRKRLSEIIKEVVGTSIPAEGDYSLSPFTEIPPLSKHVRYALIAAVNIAEEAQSKSVRSRHLFSGALSVQCGLIKALLDNKVDPEKILSKEASPTPAKPRAQFKQPNAGIRSDDPLGTDLLDITQEVEALCTVLAAKDVEPPLSLGLFGDWGSGKSFFMRKMEQRFNEIKEVASKGESDYCANIVQLWFNAWHYMDTNLWASLATEIFDELAQALAKQDALEKGSTDPDYERAQLAAQGANASFALAKAEQEKSAAEAQLLVSEQQLASIQRGDADVAVSPQAILHGAYSFAVQQPEVRKTVETAEKDLNQKVEQAAQAMNINADTTTLKEQMLELQGIFGYVRAISLAMRNAKNRKRWLISIAVFLAAAVGIVWLLPLVLGADIFKAATIRTIGALLAISGAVAPFIPGVRNALRIIDGAIKSNQELIEKARQGKEKELQQQKLELQKKVAASQQQIVDAKASAAEVKEKLDNLRSDRQMANFIRQRQQSTDYTKYLGVIAKARNDFEQLSTLLAKERERYETEGEARRKKQQEKAQGRTPQAAADDAGQPAPDEEKLILPRIDRIILYIDDLDRCPEEKVVDVLQAVHLLLAFPLFIVVVGVDPRWLLHSLRQHSNAFKEQEDEVDLSKEERTHWQSTPLNYLEKIFQIPFTLWPMEKSGFTKMIDNLTSPPERKGKNGATVKTAVETPAPEKPKAEPGDINAGEQVIAQEGVQTPATPAAGVNVVSGTVNTAQQTGAAANPQTPSPQTRATVEQQAAETSAETSAKKIDPHPEHLQIKPWERDFMTKLHSLIPSPRATKRFVNVYRLIRASVDIGDEVMLEEFVGDEIQGEYRAVLLLLAILTGYPDQATEILRHLLEKKPDMSWRELIESFKERAEKRQAATDRNGERHDEDSPAAQGRSVKKKSTVAVKQVVKSQAAQSSNGKTNEANTSTQSDADAERWEQLFEKLETLQPLVGNQSCADFVKWAPKVARYSFQSGRVLLMQSLAGSND